MMRFILSPVAYAVWYALNTPENWVFDRHTATHKPSHTELWIGNGPWFFDVRDTGTIGLAERWIVYWKFYRLRRQWRKAQALQQQGQIVAKLLGVSNG